MIAPAKKGWPKIPESLEEIKRWFGNPVHYCFDEAVWQRAQMVMLEFPAPLVLSWDTSVETYRTMCHKRVAPVLKEVYELIHAYGLWRHLDPFGGCYCFRTKRQSGEYSTHTWGIAVDHDPLHNRVGTKGAMPEEVVGIFKDCGFTWGGDWNGRWRDPMHFQYAQNF